MKTPAKKPARDRALSAGSVSARAVTADVTARARTIVFVHGIGNKPPPAVLKLQWDKALFGFDLGERSRMAYWVNRDRHGAPLSSEPDPDEVAALAPVSAFGTVAASAVNPAGDQFGEPAAITRLRQQLDDHDFQSGGLSAKVLPLPGFAREWITRAVTRNWL
jgi:hypothetical protein